MQVVILCGGKGTRLREQTESIPKPLIEIGGKPVLWHIMKIYSHYGFNDFILCLGYLGHRIREFFLNYSRWQNSDLLLRVGDRGEGRYQRLSHSSEQWRVLLAETGEETNTGGRIKRVEPYIKGETFMVTYADGLANIDLRDLLKYHRSKGKVGTVTVLNPVSNYGILEFERSGTIVQFKEKPKLEVWINGGFFVFQRKVFDYIGGDSVLEREPFEGLVKDRQLVAYPHKAFWASMDTYKDAEELNRRWNNGEAPWKVWTD
jgi:glucose-1-phosphate cytidylyltransferase